MLTSMKTRDPDHSVLVSSADGIGQVTLNRPDQLNAINDEIRTGLPTALALLDADPAVRVILINAVGERGFCVGADIKEFRENESAIAFRQRTKRMAWIEALDATAKPVIAAVQGYCFGGGLELALACDIRIASTDAVFALPEVNLGLIPGGGGTQRLSRTIGLGRAMDLLLTGDRFTARQALDWGVITRLSESAATLQADALALARLLSQKPPTALSYAKEAARDGYELELRAGLALERDLFALLMDSDERREAAAAFKEKRKPSF
jgi:enoyl-CoA hydratase